ncbi:cytochrome c oxidase subunit II [Paenibacillus turpanensis]|uniref:cytochrome c oxidase subunit II n=1 Tax=Paenibacillus turpanensis TaxID=2689078 RepID=UPI00140A800F|nr:cytochrome c oxidase subunit II [Paenibacillus turpanensis]
MHIHRLEKIWLQIGIGMLILFLAITGVNAFAMGQQPPTGHHMIDPAKVKETAPFDKPGLHKISENEYELVIIGYAFGYTPGEVEVPAGAKIRFTVTSSDVVHGFQIPNTAVNLMVVPGEVNHMTYTFKEPGDYLVLCNEYCGAAHEGMKMIIKVR